MAFWVGMQFANFHYSSQPGEKFPSRLPLEVQLSANADPIRPGDCSGSNGRVMTFITLPQSGSIIDLDSVSFVIRIQSKTGGRGIRIGLGHSELQIITPDDARRFLEELRESKQVDVENLLRWIRLTSTSMRSPAEARRPATSPQPKSVGT